MLVRALRGWPVWCLVAGLAAGCGLASHASPPAPGVAASAVGGRGPDLPLDRAFMLVVVDAGDPRLAASEAYGDWQAYLKSFVERRRGDLPVRQVAPEQASRLLAKWPPGLRNGTLFANPRGQGLLHRGLLLEPQAYLIGKAFAETGSSAPEAASFGLEPFAWQ